MDSCIVCCKPDEDIFARITTASTEWTDLNIQRIIQKHLWWWYLRPQCDDGTLQWICGLCWHKLLSFHNYYNMVEKEHKLLLSLVKSVKVDLAVVDIKVEEQHFDNESMLTEKLLHLEKRKRGRKKKNDNKSENIQIVEFASAQIKHEAQTNSTSEDKAALVANNILEKNEIGFNAWEHSFLNEIECITGEANNNEEYEHDKLDVLLSKTKRKVKSKSNAVTKYIKKYTKENKNKAIKKNVSSNQSEAMKKNDEFIADNQFQLSCNICSISLSNFNKLKNHFRKEHDTLGYAMCCNKKFYKRGVLVDHLNVHKDPNYFKCLQCSKVLSTRRSYEMHIETHKLYETCQNLFTCEKCNKSFMKKPVFDRHVLTHVPEEERKFQCSMCDKKFASEYLCKQHFSLTHSKKYAKICDICGKLSWDSFSFIRHMAEHNGETPAKVECEICGAQLTNKYRLNRHKKMMHTEVNQQEQICPYCSKVSPNLNAHKLHVKYTHTLERKHACNMCDKKFRRPLELKEHLSTHTGEPLYTCPHCPRTFISNANMHKHRKLTHRKEWEEAKMKKEARALAGKKFLKALDVTQNEETLYKDLVILGPENKSEANFDVQNFLK